MISSAAFAATDPTLTPAQAKADHLTDLTWNQAKSMAYGLAQEGHADDETLINYKGSLISRYNTMVAAQRARTKQKDSLVPKINDALNKVRQLRVRLSGYEKALSGADTKAEHEQIKAKVTNTQAQLRDLREKLQPLEKQFDEASVAFKQDQRNMEGIKKTLQTVHSEMELTLYNSNTVVAPRLNYLNSKYHLGNQMVSSFSGAAKVSRVANRFKTNMPQLNDKMLVKESRPPVGKAVGFERANWYS